MLKSPKLLALLALLEHNNNTTNNTIVLWQLTQDMATKAKRQQLVKLAIVEVVTDINAAASNNHPSGYQLCITNKNWQRAQATQANIYSNCYSPSATFDDKQFTSTFRITREMADNVLNKIARANPFFQQQCCCNTTNIAIDPKAKLLIVLKHLATGASTQNFVDYHQLSYTTAKQSVLQLCCAVANSKVLRNKYMHSMTCSDVKAIASHHNRVHGVDGMIGSIDCTHFAWKNCPVAWQGAYHGAKGGPTLVLEALTNYNLHIWEALLLAPGALNDINIWEQSQLLQKFTDGLFIRNVDFCYTVRNEIFTKLWATADGIYPSLARFVKAPKVPAPGKEYYTNWQTATRKDVERAFGVLKSKF